MQNEVILTQITILAILVLIGVLATKMKVITESSKKGLADIVFEITLPLLIITTFARIDLNPEILKNSGIVFLFTYLVLGSMFLFGLMSSKLLKLKGPQKAVMINHHMFGNIVFLGFPLMDALFPGGQGLLYAAVFQLASNSIMWTAGVWIFLKGSGQSGKQVWRNMINPNTIAFFIGILFIVVKIDIPDVIFDPLYGLGKTTIYLSMLYIGAMLMQTKVKGIFKKKHVFLLSFNKLILVPLFVSLIVYSLTYFVFPDFGLISKKVILLQASMPCMATIVVMANKYHSDDQLATENVFVSTIFSVMSIPFIYAMLLQLDKVFI